MAFRRLIPTEGKTNWEKIIWILGLGLLAFVFVIAGLTACGEKPEEEAVGEQESVEIEEGKIKFEGVVKVAVGKYLYVPEVQGFDIVIQGVLESGESSDLVGKEVRGEGAYNPDMPSILIADTLEVKEGEDEWKTIFTRTGEAPLEDYIGLKKRDEFQVLEKLAYDKKNTWEEIEKGLVQGKLETKTITEKGERKDINYIVIFDEKESEVGKIIIDKFTDYAVFYKNKLKIFDKFWYYITIKDSVDWKTRRRTREMFHADVLLIGLF